MGQTQDQKEKAQSISLVNKDSPQQKTSKSQQKWNWPTLSKGQANDI